MLESLVASILNRTLGSYVEDFDPNQLNIGIWSGDAKLRDLKLKKEALDRIGLPLSLKLGHIGQLTLQIPWSNLGSKPVRILIEDVLIFARAKLPETFDTEEENAKEQRIKRQKLDSLELGENTMPNSATPEEKAQNESFIESLTNKIVDNLQITIKNIHFRYEDDNAFTNIPYAVGITLEEVSAVSTNGSWEPQFITDSTDLTRKLLTLRYFSIYWETNTSSIYSQDEDEMIATFRRIIQTNSSSKKCNAQYLLKPVSGHGHLTVNKFGSTKTDPHYKLDVFFDEFGITLDNEQYRDICWTLSQVTQYKKTYKFRRLRPHVTVEEDPKKWLQYTFKCVFNEIQERDYRWTWDYFKKRRDQRKEYVKMWTTHLEGTENAEDIKERENLENECEYNDLKFYRELAVMQFKQKHNTDPHIKQVQKQEESTQSSWFGWWNGNSSTTNDENGKSTDDSLTLTEVQRQELYKAIGYDENKKLVDSIDLPPETVKIAIGWNLTRGSLMIKNTSSIRPLAGIIFEGMQTDVLKRRDSLFMSFKLKEFKVEDGATDTLYKHIVSVKPFDGEAYTSDDEQSKGNNDLEMNPFFEISYELNPLDNSADSELFAKMRSMTIFHNPRFIERVIRFFRPPEIHSDTIGAIMNAAESTVQDITERTRIGLQYAFEEHKTINCKMDLQAPLIIMPLDCKSWLSPVLILDAGHISVESDLADKKLIKKFTDVPITDPTEEQQNEMTSLLYDKFKLKLEDAQMLIGPDIKSTIGQLHSEGSKPSLILDHLSISILLELSIIPSYKHLSLMKISGDIPRIRAALNDYQHRIFMQAILTMMPDISGALFTPDQNKNDDDQLQKLVNTDEVNQPYELENNSKNSSDKIKASKDTSNQHNMDVNLKIGLIVISLGRCVNPSTFEADKLANVVGKDFRMSYYSTEQTMHAHITLSDFIIYDLMETAEKEEFKKLVSASSSKSNHQTDDLFVVDYTKKERTVKFKGKSIPAFDQVVKMDLSQFTLVLTRKSVLTLVNFFRNMFVDPNAPLLPADQLRHNDEKNSETAPEHMDFSINLMGISIILNDDGYRIGTLNLGHAIVNMLLLPEKMKVDASIGNFSLNDDVNDSIPSLQKLISIRGNNLAKLHYETFDPETNELPYSSAMDFQAGSIVVTFIESSFARIYSFLSRFSKMKDIYDHARETALNQAETIEGTDKMKFHIFIRSPIFIFPHVKNPAARIIDDVTAHLGEIEASNKFTESSGSIFNITTASLKSTKLSSKFSTTDESYQNLDIIDRFDVQLNVNYYDGKSLSRPATIMNALISGDNMKLTEWQTRFILEILQSVPRAFSDDLTSNENYDELENDAANANMIISRGASPSRNELHTGSMASPSLSTGTPIMHNFNSGASETRTLLNMDIDIPILALTLYNNTKGVSTLRGRELSTFSINGLEVNYKSFTGGNSSTTFRMKSFVVNDTRPNMDTKFKNIIPAISSDRNQLEGKITSTNVSESSTVTTNNVSINNPTLIVSMDYAFALKSFVDVAFGSINESSEVDNQLATIDENISLHTGGSKAPKREQTELSQSNSSTSYGINVSDPSIILLADPTKSDTEAVVFKISDVSLKSSRITKMNIDGIGMFLCNMNAYSENRLRIIDDFSVNFKMDTSGCSPTAFLTQASMKIDRLMVRVSLRDIKLAMDIFDKASVMYTKGLKNAERSIPVNRSRRSSFASEIGQTLSHRAPSVLSSLSKISQKPQVTEGAIIKGEKLMMSFGGIRMVLIGDVHELPIVDWAVQPFSLCAKNWSTDFVADSSIQSLIHIYNYSTSSWEPFLDPWSFSFHVKKLFDPKPRLTVEISSKKMADFTITARSIATLSHFAQLIGEESEIKPRGRDSPYLIVNQTGFDLNLWNDYKSNTKERVNLTHLKNGNEIPWAFEDWREIRENLGDQQPPSNIGVELLDSEYKSVTGISLVHEGESVFMLKPKTTQGYHNRLACQVILANDKVKHVILKSTVTVHNHTESQLCIGIGHYGDEVVVDREIHMGPGAKIALPIDYVYEGKIVMRPEDTKQQFGWSNTRSRKTGETMQLDWRTLMEEDLVLRCPQISSGNAPNYYFRATAKYSKSDALSSVYPHMVINITPPLMIQNLLPYDIKWEVFQRGMTKWENIFKEGESCSIHVVDMNSPVVIKVTILDSKFGKSRPAIINSTNPDIPVDKFLKFQSDDGQVLHIRLLYKRSDDARMAVTVYTPYLMINRTGEDLAILDRGGTFVSSAKGIITAGKHLRPDMFSFAKDDSKNFISTNFETNRISLCTRNSSDSIKFNIDKVGQSFLVKIPLKGRPLEDDVGVHITEGEGKFNLTKVVTFTPRFIVRNNLDLPLFVKSPANSQATRLNISSTTPIYGISELEPKKLIICVGDDNSSWSAPFSINDIGEIYLRVKLHGTRVHRLLRIVISTENGSIFINIIDAKNNWPYSIRNFSDYEFIVFQSDPAMKPDGTRSTREPFKPTYYRIPSRSVMPYAWDYPASEVKELVLRCGNKERYIQLAEIGTLYPMKVPGTNNQQQANAVDLNVTADGPVQLLIISNYDSKTSLYQPKIGGGKDGSSTSSTSSTTKGEFEAEEIDSTWFTSVDLLFKGVGISLINSKNQEICYLTVDGVELKYRESKLNQNLAMKLKWLHIDNQLFGTTFPVLLYPTIIPRSKQDVESHPAFSAGISRVKDQFHGVNYIKFATILLQEMSIELDEQMLTELMEFGKSAGSSWVVSSKDKLWDNLIEIPSPPDIRTSNDFYFELLHLQPLQFNISFERTDDEEDDKPVNGNPLSLAVNAITMAVGNVKDAPVRLSALILENVRTPLPYLMVNIQEHYKQAFLYQWYKVLGSADVIGNPVGLFNNISSGVMDIFYEPYQGYIMTDRPEELGIGLAKGGLSFIKKSVYGVSDSVSRFTNSLAKGLTAATMDKDFQQERRQNRRKKKADHPLGRFASGTSSLIGGITSGVTGLATAPIEEASKDGPAGFFKGLGKGLIGLPTKAATGLFDFANDISEGIKSTTSSFDNDNLRRIRLPRNISYDGCVTTYSQVEAQGQYWLKTCEGGKYSRDNYLAHVVLPGNEHVCIVSMSRILLVSMETLRVDWDISYEDITSITLERTGISIKQNRGNVERFISVPEKADQKFLYQSIGTAVKEYNKNCTIVL